MRFSSYEIVDGKANVDMSKSSDEEVMNAVAGSIGEAVGRSILLPEATGLVSAMTKEPSSEETKTELLLTVHEGARMFNDMVQIINHRRKNNGHGVQTQIPIIEPVQYAEHAEDWLTESRLKTAELLPYSSGWPRLLVPRLPKKDGMVYRKEVIDCWRSAGRGSIITNGKLDRWDDNELSGYDPDSDEDVQFSIIPTAYDTIREGTPLQQGAHLEELQFEYPRLSVTNIFEGALLARGRGMLHGFSNEKWKNSYTIDVSIPKEDDRGTSYVPMAHIVEPFSHVKVGETYVKNSGYKHAARLKVI